MLGFDDYFEAAVDHAFHVKGHLVRLWVFHEWILPHLRIDHVPVLTILEHDVREHHCFAGLGPYCLWELDRGLF